MPVVVGDRTPTRAPTLLTPASAWLHSTSVTRPGDEALLSPSPNCKVSACDVGSKNTVRALMTAPVKVDKLLYSERRFPGT